MCEAAEIQIRKINDELARISQEEQHVLASLQATMDVEGEKGSGENKTDGHNTSSNNNDHSFLNSNSLSTSDKPLLIPDPI